MTERFMVVPFTDGWKVLDMKRGRYIRAYEWESQAKRYARDRNRKHCQATAPRFVIGRGGEWVPAS